MSSYPPPPIKLPPGYVPLPHGQLGPAKPFPYPNPQQFVRGPQFHPSHITRQNASPYPVLPATLPYQSPGQMRWPQQQFQPQKWVTQYAGPDQDFGAGCGCSGAAYGGSCGCGSSDSAKHNGAIFGAAVEGASAGLKTVIAIGVAAALISLLP